MDSGHDRKSPTIKRALILIGALALVGGGAFWLAGCVVPVPKGDNPLNLKLMSPGQLQIYSEEVFRKQNRVMSRLMMTPLEDDDSLSSSTLTRLENAEQRMNEACASLNQVASARSRGEDTSLQLENEVRETVRDCDSAARRLETLLDETQRNG